MYKVRRSAVEILLVIALLCSVAFAQEQQAANPPDVEMYRPTAMPDRIVLTVTADPATSQAVTWRTDTSVKNGIAQIALADPGPKFEPQAQVVPATSSEFTSKLWSCNYHSVLFRDLKPDTLYAYRVGDGANWSEWLHFRTASDKPEPFSFIYFGDVQNGIRPLWSRVIREAFRTAPSARFLTFAGDLVGDGTNDPAWGELFGRGSWLYGMIPMLPSPGNHEYYKDSHGNNVVTKHWRAQFTLPENGPEGLAEYTYYTDYQGLRMISLNSSEKQAEQAVWLDKVLSANPNRWTIAIFHHPIFATARGRNQEELRKAWQPVFDKYKVDLVFTGHDHTYARSGVVQSTVYVNSVSGSKMYGLESKPWMVRAAQDTQLFQVISIDGDKLSYESRTATGSLYDAFELHKQPGQANKLVDRIPADVPERVPSPAAAVN